jgi:hypothetical protein
MAEPARFAAQAVLAGAPADARSATAERLAAAPPSADVARRAAREFEALGFKTGPAVGHSFSIEGSADLFRSTFGLALVHAPDGSVREQSAQGKPVSTLPLNGLPASLRSQLKQVLFSAPPAFGPGTLP